MSAGSGQLFVEEHYFVWDIYSFMISQKWKKHKLKSNLKVGYM